MRHAVLFALALLSGCDPNPKGAKPPPSQDACNRALGDWKIAECRHLVLDGGQAFETPGGATLTVSREGNEIVVGGGDAATKMTPSERTESRCAGPGLVLVLTGEKSLEIERVDPEFTSHCTLTR